MITLNACGSKPSAVNFRIDVGRRFLPYPPSDLQLSNTPRNLRLQSANFGDFNKPAAPRGGESFPDESFYTSVKAAVVGSITAAAAILLSRRYISSRTFLALQVPVETAAEAVTLTEEEMEKLGDVIAQSNDLAGLKRLREVETDRRKLPEAIGVLNKLILLQPEEPSWRILKAQFHDYNGEADAARYLFDEMLRENPTRIEPYHGLISTIFYNKSIGDLKYVERRAEEAIELCRERNSEKGVVDFKLLIADIRTLEKEFDSALRIYEELEALNGSDFRVYLGKGIVYSLMKRVNEAEQNFEKYWDLVPGDYPHAKYFERDVVSGSYLRRKTPPENGEAMAAAVAEK
ncbi:hypothetical protein M569_08177 [Genlisea aurea]|uniref:Chloroplast lumen common family protein n=1 Tax=Genlisea aurea TaxID=192259 RepID=S8CHX3_9LAMI|nr:hypothetical protein M569_08177 [Genlisea aurea]